MVISILINMHRLQTCTGGEDVHPSEMTNNSLGSTGGIKTHIASSGGDTSIRKTKHANGHHLSTYIFSHTNIIRLGSIQE